MLCFFPRGVLDEILNLIESISEGFPSYSFSFGRAAVACAILEKTSGLEPSSETTAPRYLKLVIVPNFCPFIFISLWMPFTLFVISLVFSALISILYLVQVLSRLSTWASSSCISSARASMSLANRRLVIFLPPMLTFPSCVHHHGVSRAEFSLMEPIPL